MSNSEKMSVDNLLTDKEKTISPFRSKLMLKITRQACARKLIEQEDEYNLILDEKEDQYELSLKNSQKLYLVLIIILLVFIVALIIWNLIKTLR